MGRQHAHADAACWDPVFLGLAVSRFCRVLGTLLHNGVPIIRSLQISRDATGNRVLADAIGKATENISAGQPLAGPLGASGQFPPIVVEMIAVAEQANNLETVLVPIAETQERETWRRLDLTVRLMEPIMLLDSGGHHPRHGDRSAASRIEDEPDSSVEYEYRNPDRRRGFSIYREKTQRKMP